MATGYVDHMLKEAIETKLNPRKFNRDGGFTLSWSWYPVIDMLKQYRDTFCKAKLSKHLALPTSSRCFMLRIKHGLLQCNFPFEKGSRTQRVTQNSVGEWWC
jgi:hypothetical protein